MRNCTAAETEEHIIKKYGFNCQEGGYCRLIEPNYFYCECLHGWIGQLCNDPDYFPSRDMTSAMISVYFPLIGIFLLLLIVVAVVSTYFVIRRRRSVEQHNQVGGGSDGVGTC